VYRGSGGIALRAILNLGKRMRLYSPAALPLGRGPSIETDTSLKEDDLLLLLFFSINCSPKILPLFFNP
jgi:hypothetical protein